MKKTYTRVFGACYALIMLFLLSSTSVNGQYCTITTSSTEDHITNFTFSGIENNTGGTNYSDFTDMTAQVVPGVSYPVTVKMENSGTYTEHAVIYIDWDQDEIFTEDERYHIGSCSGGGCSTTGISGMIDVPHNALPGTTRIRVIGRYNEPHPSACGSFTYGEIEDYSVEVQVGECTPPNFEYIITNNCEAETYSVQAVLNDFGTNNFVSVVMTRSDGVSVFPVSISSMLPPGFVFQLINDVPTGVTVTAVVQGINPVCNLNRTWSSMGCYCIPEYTYECEYNNNISNVSLSGETVDLDNSSGCSTSAYAYYGDLAQPDLLPGETYTLSVSTPYGSPTFQQAIAWIDYNRDGDLDENEIIGNTNGFGFPGGTANLTFTVPEDVNPGISYRLRVRMVYGSSIPTWDACSNASEGETEDYKITILELPDCEGTPTAGTIAIEEDIYCANSPIELVATGASIPANGLSRIWQSSPTGENNWTDIVGATASTYTYSNMDAPSDFRYKITCTLTGQTDISNTITLELKDAAECYCIPVGTNSTYYINSFTTTEGLENITNNETGFSTGGYGDYTADATLTAKQVKTQSVDFSFVGGGDYNTYGFRIWVDWNQDGQFDPISEVAYQSSSYSGVHTGTITVPETALAGMTRMRIVSHYWSATGDISPCATNHSEGEFEDYNFEVVPLETCEGTPTAGIQDETMSVCAYADFSLMISDVSEPAEGLTRIWQSSPAGQNDWTDIAGSLSTTYLVQGGIGEPTDYRFRATCDFSNETDYSNVIEVTLNPGDECYCEPTYLYGGCNSNDRITNVLLNGESILLDNTSTCSPESYGDYTETQPKPDLAPGELYTISVSTDYSSPDYEDVKAWIDYNQNGFFEPSELIANTDGNGMPSNGTQTFEFSIPNDVPAGDYRLRVRLVYSTTTWDACTEVGYGEIEDYMVTIIQLEACEGTPNAGTPDEAAFTVCALTPFNVSVSDGADAANGLTRIWQLSPAGQNDWVDIEGASARNFTHNPGIDEATDFRYTVMCENSGEGDISDIIQVTLKPGTECYCTPSYSTGCQWGELISNVN